MEGWWWSFIDWYHNAETSYFLENKVAKRYRVTNFLFSYFWINRDDTYIGLSVSPWWKEWGPGLLFMALQYRNLIHQEPENPIVICLVMLHLLKCCLTAFQNLGPEFLWMLTDSLKGSKSLLQGRLNLWRFLNKYFLYPYLSRLQSHMDRVVYEIHRLKV